MTLASVVNQTILPEKWLIVSDGSTDRTDEIVESYAAQYEWIELFRMPEKKERDFGGKARAINAGYERIKNIPHDVVACMDADLTFESDYFEFLLGKFRENEKFGLIGAPFAEKGETYDFRFSSSNHVSGACQVFRRECFETVGGYTISKGGGIDVIAVLTARNAGWLTRTFVEKHSVHHRPMGSAKDKRVLVATFKLGQLGYRLGFHPVWQVFRTIYQMSRKPYVVAGLALFFGYFWAMIRREERPIGPELVRFQRRDQMKRLRAFFKLAPRESES